MTFQQFVDAINAKLVANVPGLQSDKVPADTQFGWRKDDHRAILVKKGDDTAEAFWFSKGEHRDQPVAKLSLVPMSEQHVDLIAANFAAFLRGEIMTVGDFWDRYGGRA